MTDTPNTSRPSEAIQRYDPDIDPYRPVENGNYVRHSDHLAALARAREEARREALEEGWREGRRAAQQALVGVDYKGQGGAEVWCRCHEAIRALLTPTPQGETKEQP